MKNFTAACLFLIAAGLSDAQAQNRAGAFAAVPAPGQVPAPAATPQITLPPGAGVPRPAGQAQPGQQQQQEQLRIVADPATNSLIIYGTAQEYQNVKNILKELDAIPRQVLIEAMILQVTYSDTENFGVDYEILGGKGSSIADIAFGSRGALFSGAVAAFLKDGGLRAVVGGGDPVRAFVTALLKDSRVKLLSSPSVLATDNRPARLQVGTEEPVPTGTVSSPTGSTGISSSTTVQYRNTGRILTIIPQVNSQGLVNLQVKAEVSQRGESVSFGGGSSADTATTFPTFDTQDAETNAVVNDGETLVIGGLIGERKSKDRKGIPYLMDIPVIGRFFGTTTDQATRTELIMLITPRVIRNRTESRVVTAEFKAGLEKIKAELERLAKDRARLLPPPVVPPMPDPNMVPPLPQPSLNNVVPGRGASMAPTADVNAFSNYGSVAGEINIDLLRQRLETEKNLRAGEIHSYGQQRRDQTLEPAKDGKTPAPPLYALSIAPVPVESIRRLASQPKQQPTQPKENRIWAVQVAALAEYKLAQAAVEQLREAGYDAYVMTTQGERKTWYRVRVGRFDSHKDAIEERKALIENKQFQQAYVALN